MITVIYHRADFDGIFCREIARKFLGEENVTYIGWDYGDPVPLIPGDGILYMLDISIEPLMTAPRLIWIDHHKSAIEQFSAGLVQPEKCYCIDGVAACRLTWQYFHNTPPFDVLRKEWLPGKEAFIQRTVEEPLAVRLAGEYDIWDKRDPRVDTFQHALKSRDLNPADWDIMLSVGDELTKVVIDDLLRDGRVIQRVQEKQNESIIKDIGFDVKWEGLNFLACNHARFNSLLFTAAIRPDHDALLGFCWDGQRQFWKVSLYGIDDKDFDLSLLAVRYGGGGHRKACGFQCKELPFQISPP